MRATVSESGGFVHNDGAVLPLGAAPVSALSARRAGVIDSERRRMSRRAVRCGQADSDSGRAGRRPARRRRTDAALIAESGRDWMNWARPVPSGGLGALSPRFETDRPQKRQWDDPRPDRCGSATGAIAFHSVIQRQPRCGDGGDRVTLGRWPSSDSTGLAAQVDQVAANALVELAAAVMAPDDVVRSVICVVSDEGAALASVWNRLTSLAPAFTAASALLGISQLGFPHQHVELDLAAALG